MGSECSHGREEKFMQISVGKPEKRLEKHRWRWEDNIKIDIREI
jgi:hypothetical protein